jgi:CDP-diacylglycerol--glycerol-3-phosphate 3-phosphatidyltransferase
MLSTLVADWVRGQFRRVGLVLARTNLSPNAFTIIGFFLNLIVALVIASGSLVLGGVLALLAGGFDLLDGAVARATNQVTRFGGFLDSTLDRYSEAALYFGVLVYLLRSGSSQTAIFLVFATLLGSLMVSYTRARAEAAGLRADVGIFPRAERVILLAIFLVVQKPVWALWILALLTNLTALQRIVHVWQTTRQDDEPRRDMHR